MFQDVNVRHIDVGAVGVANPEGGTGSIWKDVYVGVLVINEQPLPSTEDLLCSGHFKYVFSFDLRDKLMRTSSCSQ